VSETNLDEVVEKLEKAQIENSALKRTINYLNNVGAELREEREKITDSYHGCNIYRQIIEKENSKLRSGLIFIKDLCCLCKDQKNHHKLCFVRIATKALKVE